MILISLFDGLGGAMDSALAAGIRPCHYVAVELDRTARGLCDWRAERNGWRKPVRPVDNVLAATGKDLLQGAPPGPVLLVGGVPCQTRSLASKKKTAAARVAAGTESGLITEFVRIRDELMAAGRDVSFVVENVPSHSAADAVYSAMLGASPVMINAAHFSPQHRRRLFWASWDISPPRKWSAECFADIAEANPVIPRWYDFIYYPAAGRKDNAPFRIGVLPSPSVLRDIFAWKRGVFDNGTRQGYKVAAASGKVNPIRQSGSSEKVAFNSTDRVYDEGGKIVACRSAAGGRGEGIVGRISEGDRIYDGEAKARSVKSHGRGVQDGAYFMPQAAGRFSEGERVYNCNAKARSVKTRAGGSQDGVYCMLYSVISEKARHYLNPNAANIEMRRFADGTGRAIVLPVVLGGARCPTILEVERLFGLADGDTKMPGVSVSARRRCLGGSWHKAQMAWVMSQIGRRGLL